MKMELDHLFICTAPGAPEAEKFLQFGLSEGPANEHPGQGTACRRFSFANAMIELFWVSDAHQAQNEMSRRTQLWERWAGREKDASPFGICLRPVDDQETEAPFPAWEYRPAYLPEPLSMYIGEVGIEEPMWIYLSFMRRRQREQWFDEHPSGLREITGLKLTTRVPLRSGAAQRVQEDGILVNQTGEAPLLEIEFDKQRRKEWKDFRPDLPVVFRW